MRIEKIKELIEKELEEYGIKTETYESIWSFFTFDSGGTSTRRVGPWNKNTEKIDRTIEKIDKLIEHLGLEYYKKEIKETNGTEREYILEGFRKIKKIKCKKKKKSKK